MLAYLGLKQGVQGKVTIHPIASIRNQPETPPTIMVFFLILEAKTNQIFAILELGLFEMQVLP